MRKLAFLWLPVLIVCGALMASSASFILQFARDPSTIGAVAPSSKFLAREMVKCIPQRQGAEGRMRVLEIGPGTGVFTELILERLGPNDRLDLVELDDGMCEMLEERFGEEERVVIHNTSILDYEAEPYEHAVSGLPLNIFTPEAVEGCLTKYKELVVPGGTLTYFTYPMLPTLRKAFTKGEDREGFVRVLEMKEEFFQQTHGRKTTVWRNIPPASACHCFID